MHPALKATIALVCTLFIGLSVYWIVEIVQNIRSVTDQPLITTTSTVIHPDKSVIASPVETDLESQAQQASFQVVKSVDFSVDGDILTLVHQCGGEMATIRHPITGTASTMCRGLNRIVLKRLDGQYRVLETIDAKSDSDIPLLSYTTQTVKNGPMVIMIFERNGCPINKEACSVTGFRAMTHALDLSQESYRRISAYPARAKPIWNNDGTKAVFIVQTCGSTRCDAAALIGYNLVTDRISTLTQEIGADQDYARDVTGKKLGYWQSVSWTSLTDWSAQFIDAQGLAKTLTGKVQ